MKEGTLGIVIIVVSIAVPALVSALFFLNVPVENIPFDIRIFPKFHALLNGTTACCLLLGLYFIKKGKIKAHRRIMLTAFFLSTIFLVSYVTYHSLAESTKFGEEGIIRTIYFIILLSHILLAALILPLILFTFSKALQGKIDQHRRLAKWTMPLWLYVAISGVIVYFMISPYYI